MAYRYRCYKFPNAAAFEDFQDENPMLQVAVAIPGAVREPDELDAAGNITKLGDPIPGYFVQIAWPGEPDPALDAYAIPEPLPGMTVFTGWNEPAAIGPEVTKAELLGLLTLSEQLAYVTSAEPAVALWRYKATLEDKIDLRNPSVTEALDAFAAVGILTPARRDRIAAGLPPE